MTAHLTSHGTTDIKPEMLSGVQTGNGTPHYEYDIHGIAHARTNRNDNIFMQRWLVQNFTFIIGVGSRDLFIDEAHVAGYIPGIFSLYAAYSALWHFFFLILRLFWAHLKVVHQKNGRNQLFATNACCM